MLTNVQVQIGGFTSESIGMLQYNEESQFPPAVVGVIVGILVVVAVGIFILVCVYRRRAKASDMEVKNMMMQMNQMESRVAKVCKEGKRCDGVNLLSENLRKMHFWMVYSNSVINCQKCCPVKNCTPSLLFLPLKLILILVLYRYHVL